MPNMSYTYFMARPVKDMKFKKDSASGRYMIGFAERPGTYFMSPEEDQAKALSWGRRNRFRLLAIPGKKLLIKNLAPGFFDEAGAWYQDQLKKGRSMTSASLRLRRGHIVNYIIPLFGEYDIRELSGAEIDRAILDAERYTGRDGSPTDAAHKPLARGTRSKLLYSIKLMYDRWCAAGLVKENPTSGIVKYSKTPERPRSKLPREVLEKLFPKTHGELVRVWGSSLWAALMLVLYDTGARPGEARALRWADYYPEERFIPLRHGVESGTAATIKGTKNDVIKPGYLQIRTAQELSIWRAESCYNGDQNFIFTVTGKAPVSNAAIGDAFRRALQKLGYDSTGWTPYWLRHSFVTYALESLEDSEVIMLAGHSSMQMNQHYRHPDDEIMLKRSKAVRDKLDVSREVESSSF